MSKCEITWDSADDITLTCLKYHYQLTKESLDEWYGGKGWLHRDDVDSQVLLMHHLKAVIDYYGGSVD